jgi:hypothetical protein
VRWICIAAERISPSQRRLLFDDMGLIALPFRRHSACPHLLATFAKVRYVRHRCDHTNIEHRQYLLRISKVGGQKQRLDVCIRTTDADSVTPSLVCANSDD